MSVTPIPTLPPIDSPGFTEQVTDEVGTLRRELCDPGLTCATSDTPDTPTPITRADLALDRWAEKIGVASETIQSDNLNPGEVDRTLDGLEEAEADRNFVQEQVDKLAENIALVEVGEGSPDEVVSNLQSTVDEMTRVNDELADELLIRADET